MRDGRGGKYYGTFAIWTRQGLRNRRYNRSVASEKIVHPPTDLPEATVTVTIYHNPACGTSRNTLALIRQSGTEPEIIEYLKTPPSRERLKSCSPRASGRASCCERRARLTRNSALAMEVDR